MRPGRGPADAGGRLGDKIGPRLVDLVVQAVLATRRGLAPHEARVQAAGLQQLIDRMGREVADLYAPLLADVLKRDSLHPLLREHFAKAASGTHQWQAVAGFLVGQTGAGSALQTVLSNEIAPLVYGVVRDNPHLVPDVGTVAGLLARNVISEGDAVSAGGATGYHRGWVLQLADAAAAVPDVTTLTTMVNRGLLSGEQAQYWMARSGVPYQLRGPLEALRRLELTPADAALATLRGLMSEGEGRRIAGLAGMTSPDFDVLVGNSGEPLGLEQLLEAYRRGYIDQARLVRGIRQSRVRDEWTDVAEALRYSPVATADAIDAAQRGRISPGLAAQIAEQNGVEPSQVSILEANAGNPPSPEQLLELWRRGMIDEAAVNRGLLEGRTKDEWIPQIRDLRYEPITTADAIDAWQRGHLDQAAAEKIAEQNGVEPSQVGSLLANAGNPLALEQLLEAFRRGFISESRLEQGLRESRLRNDWIPTARQLRYSPMSTADAITAAVQGNLSAAQARQRAEENGLNPEDFQPLLETAGEPLARTELQQLFNRGLISMATFRQGLRESRLKDKYVAVATQLHVRLPEPRIVTEAIADGVITAAAGEAKLRQDGYSEADARMLVTLGEIRSTGPNKQLMTGEIASLYSDRIISREAAAEMLGKLHFTAAAAGLVLDLADYKQQQRILSSGIGAIRSHYLAHRIGDTEAAADLTAMDLPAAAVALYLKVWRLDRLAHPKQLSEAQIVKAAKNGLFVPRGTLTSEQWQSKNQDAGRERLVQLGYSADDADLLLAGA